MKLSIDTQQNTITCRYAKCRNAECRYAEFRYAECRYAESRYAECLQCYWVNCSLKYLIIKANITRILPGW